MTFALDYQEQPKIELKPKTLKNQGSPPLPKCIFLNIVQKAFEKVRKRLSRQKIDKIGRKYVESMSNIP